jgi:hypothetical protein
MRPAWRRLSPGEFDHELVWLAVSIAAIAGGAVWLGLGLPWPRCPFLTVTGFPCLTCGATRCTLALVQGNFALAWGWNPLAMLALSGIAVFDLYAAVVLLSRSARLRLVDWTPAEKKAARIVVIAAIAMNWIYLLTHRSWF